MQRYYRPIETVNFATPYRTLVALIVAGFVHAMALAPFAVGSTTQSQNLPVRTSPIPQTTPGVPHVQLGVEVNPQIYSEMIRKVESIPGVEIRDSIISLPGARGFWISQDIAIARPDVIIRGREFAHVHPDGSLHASLSPDIANLAIKNGWAILHPWANQRPGWEGFVMIYTPQDQNELETVLRLVSLSYGYVTGQ